MNFIISIIIDEINFSWNMKDTFLYLQIIVKNSVDDQLGVSIANITEK